jgi:hypothetical protein
MGQERGHAFLQLKVLITASASWVLSNNAIGDDATVVSENFVDGPFHAWPSGPGKTAPLRRLSASHRASCWRVGQARPAACHRYPSSVPGGVHHGQSPLSRSGVPRNPSPGPGRERARGAWRRTNPYTTSGSYCAGYTLQSHTGPQSHHAPAVPAGAARCRIRPVNGCILMIHLFAAE